MENTEVRHTKKNVFGHGRNRIQEQWLLPESYTTIKTIEFFYCDDSGVNYFVSSAGVP